MTYNPDSAEIWREKLAAATMDFQHRRISDDVYRGWLYSAGFRGARLREEFNYQYGLRHQVEQHQTMNGRLRVFSSVSSDSS